MVKSVLLFLLIVLSMQISAITLPTDSVAVDSMDTKPATTRKHVRAKAIIFTILTGPLGGHRIYLGTRPGAPIIYAVTLGGLGILPVIDLFNIIFTKDLSVFEQNKKIIMW